MLLRSSDEVAEITAKLIEAAGLATSYRPPNFYASDIVDAWLRKFSTSEVPTRFLIKAIEKLSGEEKFPSPNSIIDLAKSYLRNEKGVRNEKNNDPEYKLYISLRRKFRSHEIIDRVMNECTSISFPKNRMMVESYLLEYLEKRTGSLRKKEPVDFELLKQYAEDPLQAIWECYPRALKGLQIVDEATINTRIKDLERLGIV